MDDTQKDGSDSDWDSTLDFTSPRQPIGNFMPRMHQEVEDEESALSNESDIEDENIDASTREKNAINNERNFLQSKDERSRSPSPQQKENNIIKAQQQRTTPRRTPKPAERGDQYTQEKEPPPYNFKEAVTGKFTPEPGGRGPPGKERKGNTYDFAPSPTPRGIAAQQGSIKSIGSWDESDPDERTLKELRANFNKEKQKEEEQKMRARELEAERSYADEPPNTNRSETTWKSWAKDKIQRKPKTAQQTYQQPQVTPQRTPQLQHQPRPQMQEVSQISQVPAQQPPLRVEVSPPSVTHSTAYQYPTPSPQVPQTREIYVPQYDIGPAQATSYSELIATEFPDEPKKLYVYDEDRGRYTYYFGHGNLKYYEVNDDFDEAKLPPYADKCERLSKRTWQEIFAVIRMIMSVFIWFFIELFRYVAKHIFQPIVHGIFATIGDFVFKPFLSALFNGFMQPSSIFLWNVFTGMRHMFRPIGEILERVFLQFAMLFRSIRLFEIHWNTGGHPQRQQVSQSSQAQIM